jgi:Trk-type K+ transport system membrane component
MSTITRDLTIFASKIDRRTIQFILILVSLGLFILGAGAPMGETGL